MVKINDNPKVDTCFKGIIPSSIGDMYFVVSEEGTLLGLSFSSDIFEDVARSFAIGRILPVQGDIGKEIIRQLDEYYKGKRREFDLTVGFVGTPFQVAVWKALLGIPYGETVSYGEIAKRIEHPLAYRAVGSAVGKNRIDIVVPCHRVIKGGGSMGNYGGGVKRKRFLLNLEAGRGLF